MGGSLGVENGEQLGAVEDPVDLQRGLVEVEEPLLSIGKPLFIVLDESVELRLGLQIHCEYFLLFEPGAFPK